MVFGVADVYKGLKTYSNFQPFTQIHKSGELKQRKRWRSQKRQKSSRFKKRNNKFCICSMLFGIFLELPSTTTTRIERQRKSLKKRQFIFWRFARTPYLYISHQRVLPQTPRSKEEKVSRNNFKNLLFVGIHDHGYRVVSIDFEFSFRLSPNGLEACFCPHTDL